MSTVAPPPPAAPAAQPPPPGGTLGTLISPPGGLAELEPGTLLRGQVTDQGARGVILIATALGELEVASRLALAPRTAVLLRLGGPGGTVTILPEDGAAQAPQRPAVPASPALAGKPAPAPSPAPAPPPRDGFVRQGAIPALVLSGPGTARHGEGPARAEVQLAPGTRLTVRIAAILPAQTGPAEPRPTHPAPANPTAPSGAPHGGKGPEAPPRQDLAALRLPVQAAEAGTKPPPLPAGQAGEPRTPAAQGRAVVTGGPGAGETAAPAARTARPGPSPAPGPIKAEGRVSGVTSDGRAILSSSHGTVILERPASLTPGLRVLFELVLPSQAATEAGRPPAAAPILTNGAGWPALSLALEALAEGGTQTVPGATAGAGSLAEAVPSPGARLGSSLLFILSALSGGSLAAWLGEAALERLERLGRGDLVLRLTQDFGQMSRLAEAQADDWRLFPLPILHEGQVTPVQLYLRRDARGSETEEAEDQATRFLVELSLSRLGELQLDGLVRGKRFDLILRSRIPLPARLRGDIAAIFEEANAITGAKGQIAFRSADDWVFLAPGTQDRDARPDLLI